MDGERFRDRAEAGQQLAIQLKAFELADPVVLGLARGGLQVGSEIAKALDAPLEVLVVRKIGFPGQPELAAGAIGEGGVEVLNDRLGLPRRLLQSTIDAEELELSRRVDYYRGSRPLDIEGRPVILVDDGIATGLSAQAAIRSARHLGAKAVVFASPVASAEAAAHLREMVDELVILMIPEHFMSVGTWYEDFPQLTDAEVVKVWE